MAILGEAEWVWTSDIGKDSKNNFPFEKGGTGQVSVSKLDFSMESFDLYWCSVLGFGLLNLMF